MINNFLIYRTPQLFFAQFRKHGIHLLSDIVISLTSNPPLPRPNHRLTLLHNSIVSNTLTFTSTQINLSVHSANIQKKSNSEKNLSGFFFIVVYFRKDGLANIADKSLGYSGVLSKARLGYVLVSSCDLPLRRLLH